MRTVVESHGSENCDQTASHGSLFPFESEPLIKLLKKKKNDPHQPNRTELWAD